MKKLKRKKQTRMAMKKPFNISELISNPKENSFMLKKHIMK